MPAFLAPWREQLDRAAAQARLLRGVGAAADADDAEGGVLGGPAAPFAAFLAAYLAGSSPWGRPGLPLAFDAAGLRRAAAAQRRTARAVAGAAARLLRSEAARRRRRARAASRRLRRLRAERQAQLEAARLAELRARAAGQEASRRHGRELRALIAERQAAAAAAAAQAQAAERRAAEEAAAEEAERRDQAAAAAAAELSATERRVAAQIARLRWRRRRWELAPRRAALLARLAEGRPADWAGPGPVKAAGAADGGGDGGEGVSAETRRGVAEETRAGVGRGVASGAGGDADGGGRGGGGGRAVAAELDELDAELAELEAEAEVQPTDLPAPEVPPELAAATSSVPSQPLPDTDAEAGEGGSDFDDAEVAGGKARADAAEGDGDDFADDFADWLSEELALALAAADDDNGDDAEERLPPAAGAVVPVAVAVERCVGRAVEAQYRAVSALTVRLVLDGPAGLAAELAALRRWFFLGDGEFAQGLVAGLLRFRRTGRPFSREQLASLLAAALGHGGPGGGVDAESHRFAAKLDLRLDLARLGDLAAAAGAGGGGTDLEFLGAVELAYRPAGPAAAVLTPAAAAAYSQVFRFLARLRWARLATTRICHAVLDLHKALRARQPGGGRAAGGAGGAVVGRVRALELFRHEVHHLVGALEALVLGQLAGGVRQTLERGLGLRGAGGDGGPGEGAGPADLEELRRLHAAYLLAARRCCLLTPELRPAAEFVAGALGHVAAFHDLLLGPAATAAPLAAVEDGAQWAELARAHLLFRNCAEYLFRALRGGQGGPALAEVAASFDFNGYYERRVGLAGGGLDMAAV